MERTLFHSAPGNARHTVWFATLALMTCSVACIDDTSGVADAGRRDPATGAGASTDAAGSEPEGSARQDASMRTDAFVPAPVSTADAGSVIADLLSPVPETKHDACVAYVRALDAAWLGCVGAPPRDPGVVLRDERFCPDFMFADGSRRTLQDVVQCARALAQVSCDALLAGSIPACAPVGERALGDACQFDSQCVTGRCGGSPGWCSQCQELLPDGATCEIGDRLHVCGDASLCMGTCTPVTEETRWYRFGGRSFCGGPENLCPSGQLCADPQALECTPLPEAGEACRLQNCTSGNRCEQACASGLACIAQSLSPEPDFACMTVHGAGEPCVGALCLPEAYCADGIHDPPQTTPGALCRARGSDGEPCPDADDVDDELENHGCLLDHLCVCDGGDCSTGGGAQVCRKAVGPGQPCGPDGPVCRSGDACKEGVCPLVSASGPDCR